MPDDLKSEPSAENVHENSNLHCDSEHASFSEHAAESVAHSPDLDREGECPCAACSPPDHPADTARPCECDHEGLTSMFHVRGCPEGDRKREEEAGQQYTNALYALQGMEYDYDRLEEAVKAALDELGVDDGSYPAPVANAVAILTKALHIDGLGAGSGE